MIPSRTSAEAEYRVRLCDGDVRACDQPRATAERVSVDAADDGRGARVDCLEHPVEAQRVLDVLVVVESIDERCHSTSAPAQKLAVAGEHDRAGVADVRERLGELGDERRVECVPPLGACERDAEDSPSRSTRSASIAETIRFRGWPRSASGELERVGKTATMFRVPFDLKEAFGRARPPVAVTIRGHTWRTTPGVYDGVGHVVVSRAVKAATGVDAGDRVRITMELATAPRTVDVPPDLGAALARERAARAAFDRLSYTHRCEYVAWAVAAKRADTRERRVAATVERVRSGEPVS